MAQADPLFALKQYFSYYFQARNAHGLHSPFLFDLYNTVIKESKIKRIPSVEKVRKNLLNDHKTIEIKDWKSGGIKTIKKSKTIRNSTASSKFASFLMLLANKLHVETILETGTCAGITTSYLTHSNAINVVSIEGDSALVEIAEDTVKKCNQEASIQYGDLQELFGKALVNYIPDFIFLDADHRSSTLLSQIDLIKSSILKEVKVIVVHDIHWSRDMNRAWKQIVKDSAFSLTVDIFEAGLIFPNRVMEKQHLSLKF